MLSVSVVEARRGADGTARGEAGCAVNAAGDRAGPTVAAARADVPRCPTAAPAPGGVRGDLGDHQLALGDRAASGLQFGTHEWYP
jgi:hypothetical protein